MPNTFTRNQLEGRFREHIEDVLTRGDTLDVIVQEVDKERGRIGLKLVAKHEDGALVMPDVLIERAEIIQ